MQGEITAYEPGESLTVRFPVLERYQNPTGYMQVVLSLLQPTTPLDGLAYLVAPSVTTHMMVEYVRPVKKIYTHFVEGASDAKTVKQLFLTATIASEHGQILARCHAAPVDYWSVKAKPDDNRPKKRSAADPDQLIRKPCGKKQPSYSARRKRSDIAW